MKNFFDRSPAFRTMVVWIVSCLLLLLMTSCASRAPTARLVLPPLPMLEPRPIPQWTGRTYRDLAAYSLRLRESAMASEADKAAARAVLEVAP